MTQQRRSSRSTNPIRLRKPSRDRMRRVAERVREDLETALGNPPMERVPIRDLRPNPKNARKQPPGN